MNADPETAASTPYLAIGGKSALRTLVQRFYELMDSQPEAFAVRRLHPADHMRNQADGS